MEKLVRGQRIPLEALGLGQQGHLQFRVEGIKFPFFIWKAWVLNEMCATEHFYCARTDLGADWITYDDFLQLHYDLQPPTPEHRLWVGISFEDRPHGLEETAYMIIGGHLASTTHSWSFERGDFELSKTVVLAELYQKQNVWRLGVVGQGYSQGIQEFVRGLNPYAQIPAQFIPPQMQQAMASSQEYPNRNPSSHGVTEVPAAVPPVRIPKVASGRTLGDQLKAVAQLSIEAADGNWINGTAFCITPGGHLLTCQHLIEGARQVRARFHGDADFRALKVLREDKSCDTALLWLEDGAGYEWWLALGQDTLAAGQEVLAVSYRTQAETTALQFASKNQFEGLDYIQLKVPLGAAAASAGSPLIRQGGDTVLGMVQSSLHTGTTMNMALDTGMWYQLDWLNRF